MTPQCHLHNPKPEEKWGQADKCCHSCHQPLLSMPEKGHSRTDIGTVKQRWPEHGLQSNLLQFPERASLWINLLCMFFLTEQIRVLGQSRAHRWWPGQDQHGGGEAPLDGKSMGTWRSSGGLCLPIMHLLGWDLWSWPRLGASALLSELVKISLQKQTPCRPSDLWAVLLRDIKPNKGELSLI